MEDGDTVIGTSPSKLWRVVLKCKKEDLGGVLITASGWTHQETPEETSHRLLDRGASHSPSGVCQISPTGARCCGMMQQYLKSQGATSFQYSFGHDNYFEIEKDGHANSNHAD